MSHRPSIITQDYLNSLLKEGEPIVRVFYGKAASTVPVAIRGRQYHYQFKYSSNLGTHHLDFPVNEWMRDMNQNGKAINPSFCYDLQADRPNKPPLIISVLPNGGNVRIFETKKESPSYKPISFKLLHEMIVTLEGPQIMHDVVSLLQSDFTDEETSTAIRELITKAENEEEPESGTSTASPQPPAETPAERKRRKTAERVARHRSAKKAAKKVTKKAATPTEAEA